MQSIENAISILNNLPQELLSLVFNYLKGLDMVNFIDKTDIPINIESLNITNEELIIWELLENENKLFKWCKILYDASDNKYYKTMYKTEHRYDLKLPTGKENKYIFKLKMGLFVNASLNYINSSEYSKLDFDSIGFIFNTLKNHTNKYSIYVLKEAIEINKNNNDYINYIKTANRIKEIRSLIKCFTNKADFKIVVSILPDSNYKRLIYLMENGSSLSSAYYLTKNNKYSDELIQKFLQLKQELEYDNKMDDIISSNLKNDKFINYLRIFKNKNFSFDLIRTLLAMKREIIDYLFQNNIIYKFNLNNLHKFIWPIHFSLENIYDKSKELFKEIFNKFTIKQQNNLHMKQLMEDNGYNDLLEKYVSENIRFVNNYIKNPYNTISEEQYFNAYIELTEEQFKYFKEQINNGSNYEEALANAYQIVYY